MQIETVVLLHGIARTRRSMRALEKALLKEGYRVLNIDYPSRKQTISELASYVHGEINRNARIADERLHFVGHSMGCLIIRNLLANHPLKNVGNIVMLGPPNQGSEVADFLEANFLYQQFYGPAGRELTTRFAEKTPHPMTQHAFGVIAGNICLDPISYFLLPKGNDGKVTIERTKLEGMRDHIVLSCSHSFIQSNREVIRQVIHFLKHAKFARN